MRIGGERLQGWFRENERILALCIATFLVMVGQGITSPILPLYAREFGVSTAMVGLTLTAFALARLILNIPAGQLADRRGRRPFLIAGPLVLAVGMFGSGLAVGIWDLLAWRFVAGCGSAFYMGTAQLYILDVSPAERRGRNLSYNAGALLAGVALGPAVGGIVAELTTLRMPFLLVGGLFVLAAIYSWKRLPETGGDSASPARLGRAKRQRGEKRPAFLLPGMGANFGAICLISFCLFSVRAGSRGTLVPLLAVDQFGMSKGELGAILGATGLVGLVLIGPAGQAADRLGRKRTILPSGFFACAGLLAIVVSPTTGWLTASLFLLALGTTLAGPASYAFIADITVEEERGRALGLYRSAGDIGFLISAPLLGALADRTNIDTAMLVNAAIIGAAACYFLIVARERVSDSVGPQI